MLAAPSVLRFVPFREVALGYPQCEWEGLAVDALDHVGDRVARGIDHQRLDAHEQVVVEQPHIAVLRDADVAGLELEEAAHVALLARGSARGAPRWLHRMMNHCLAALAGCTAPQVGLNRRARGLGGPRAQGAWPHSMRTLCQNLALD